MTPSAPFTLVGSGSKERSRRTDLRVVLVVLEMELEKRPYDTSHSLHPHSLGNLRDEGPVLSESLFVPSQYCHDTLISRRCTYLVIRAVKLLGRERFRGVRQFLCDPVPVRVDVGQGGDNPL